MIFGGTQGGFANILYPSSQRLFPSTGRGRQAGGVKSSKKKVYNICLKCRHSQVRNRRKKHSCRLVVDRRTEFNIVALLLLHRNSGTKASRLLFATNLPRQRATPPIPVRSRCPSTPPPLPPPARRPPAARPAPAPAGGWRWGCPPASGPPLQRGAAGRVSIYGQMGRGGGSRHSPPRFRRAGTPL